MNEIYTIKQKKGNSKINKKINLFLYFLYYLQLTLTNK